jgi:NAD+ synthetase
VTDELLHRLREARAFDAAEVAAAKIGRLTRWFAEQRLDAAVVGVSGGVDSALVLALLRAVATRERSPLRRVVALLLPIGGRGATRQAEATARGRLVADALGAETWEAPLTESLAAMIASLSRASSLSFDAWSEGQCLSVVRSPALYGAAALLRSHGLRSVVVGTTNRDEGAYLGFFGKASDGMVDLQPISDLHKSEVRALSRHLGVPEVIVDAVPSGDVHDGRVDEEMIGASYDEVELALRMRELEVEHAAPAFERKHAENRHKYAAGDPAVHLDVMPRGVPGGWRDEALSGRDERRPPPDALPGAWDPPVITLDPHATLPAWERLAIPGAVALLARDVLTHADCARLRDAMEEWGHAEPVGVTGVTATADAHDGYGIGSVRATAWSPELAATLWKRLRPAIPSVRFLDDLTPTDGFAIETGPGARTGHRSYRVVGLSPLLRFMRYDPGGRHLCHYDAGFDYGDGRRTLLSVVFYLTDAPASGATRFVRDGQEAMPTRERCFDDWSRDTRDDEIVLSVHPARGQVLVFDHRLCHDVQRWEGPGPRVIIRADVVYEAVPDGRS